MTDDKYGVYVDGAEQVIDMYERGDIDAQKLYESILDLEVVYRSKNVESPKE